MNCEAVRELLWTYLEKETTAEEAVKIEEHLKNCAVCREELELQKEIMDSLQNLPDEELPDGFHANLMQKLQVEAAPNVVPFPVKKKKAPVYKQWGMIAAAVMVVVAAGGMNGMLGMRDAQNAAVQEVQKADTVNVAEYAAEDMAAEEDSKDKVLMKANTADQKKMTAPAAGPLAASATAKDTFAVYDGEATETAEEAESFSMTRSVEVQMTDTVVLAVTDTMQAKTALQDLILAVGGYEEIAAGEDCMIAVIPVEEFESFAEKMETIGSLEWTQKGSEETGAAWRTVEIQLYKN